MGPTSLHLFLLKDVLLFIGGFHKIQAAMRPIQIDFPKFAVVIFVCGVACLNLIRKSCAFALARRSRALTLNVCLSRRSVSFYEPVYVVRIVWCRIFQLFSKAV